MDLKLYPLLGTRSRRAFWRIRGKYGKPYFYNPRGDLLVNLSEKTGLSIEEVYQQLLEERKHLVLQAVNGNSTRLR